MMNHIHDSKALELSREVMALVYDPMPIGGSVQLQAKIQCLFVDAMEFAGTRVSDGWIPVSERMPEGMKTVITSNGFDIGQGWWDGECWKSFDCHDVVPGKVTHWMPLPEAPQQGDL